jgi:hypothetical protein
MNDQKFADAIDSSLNSERAHTARVRSPIPLGRNKESENHE